MIPIFKSTEQALAYGKLVGGDSAKIKELSEKREYLKAQIKILSDYEKDYQELMNMICQSQFVREALEEATSDKYKLRA